MIITAGIEGATWLHVFRAFLDPGPQPDGLLRAVAEHSVELGFGPLAALAASRAVVLPKRGQGRRVTYSPRQTGPIFSTQPKAGDAVLFDHTVRRISIETDTRSVSATRRNGFWDLEFSFPGGDPFFVEEFSAVAEIRPPTEADRDLMIRMLAARQERRAQFLTGLAKDNLVDVGKCLGEENLDALRDNGHAVSLRKAAENLGWRTQVRHVEGMGYVVTALPRRGFGETDVWERLDSLAWYEYPYGLPEANWLLRETPLALLPQGMES